MRVLAPESIEKALLDEEVDELSVFDEEEN
jgi:hypothetical protein